MDEGREKRIEGASRDKGDAERIDGHCADEVLPDHPPHAPCDRERVGEALQVVAEQYHISTLPGHVGAPARVPVLYIRPDLEA